MSQNVRSGSKRPRNPGPVSTVLQASQFDEFTKAMLHLNGVDGSTTILDEISKIWTAYGNAQIDTAHSRFDGASALFDGTGDYVDTPDHDDFTLGSENFTIDFWMKRSVTNRYHRVAGQCDGVVNNTSASFTCIVMDTNDAIQFNVFSGSTGYTAQSAISVDTNWHHIAAVRNGNTLTLYVDGVAGATTANLTGVTLNNSSNKLAVGRWGEWENLNFAGWIDEFRFSKGIARWTANFVPQGYPYEGTSKLDDSNTKGLLHFNNPDGTKDFFDESGHIWRAFGDSQIDTAQSKFGGSSGLFDGSDYLLSDGHSDFLIGSGNFTIDFWVRFSVTTGGQMLVDYRPAGTNGFYPTVYLSGTGNLIYYTNSTVRITGATTLSANTWYHVALVRSGTDTKFYLNGTQDGPTFTGDNANYLQGGSRPVIASDGSTLGSFGLNGWMDEFRLSIGVARWTSNFTPPTAEY